MFYRFPLNFKDIFALSGKRHVHLWLKMWCICGTDIFKKEIRKVLLILCLDKEHYIILFLQQTPVQWSLDFVVITSLNVFLSYRNFKKVIFYFCNLK